MGARLTYTGGVCNDPLDVGILPPSIGDEGATCDADERAYAVEGMTCAHCRAAVAEEVGALAGRPGRSRSTSPAGACCACAATASTARPSPRRSPRPGTRCGHEDARPHGGVRRGPRGHLRRGRPRGRGARPPARLRRRARRRPRGRPLRGARRPTAGAGTRRRASPSPTTTCAWWRTRRRSPRGATTRWTFRVVGAGGVAVTDFDVEHEREMHLIVVRRDLTGYQHLHPRRDADGHLERGPAAPRGGRLPRLRRLHDGGRALTLATDLFVAGAFAPRALPAPTPVDEAERLPRRAVGRGPGARRDGRARLRPQPRRPAADRRRALPRRRRPPGRAARGRPGLPARAPGGVRHAGPHPLRRRAARRPGATVCSCSSATTAACAPSRTRWRSSP